MDRYITVNGAKVHYTVSEGDGKPLVLMHGWGCNITTLASIEKVAVDSQAVRCTILISPVMVNRPTRLLCGA